MSSRAHSLLAEAVGARIRARRIELGLTLREVAYREGFRTDFVGRAERGEQNLSLSTLARLAIALDCGIDDLVRGIDLAALAASGGFPREPSARRLGSAARHGSN